MAEPLPVALDRVRSLLLDESLVRAVAAGRRRGQTPHYRRAELRRVDLNAGPHLQVVRFDQTQALTANHEPGEPAAAAVDELLAEPFGNWHVDTTHGTLQLRVTKKGAAMVHASVTPSEPADAAREHDRRKPRLLDVSDPLWAALGIVDAQGRVKPTRQAKLRQVEEFLRALAPVVDDALASGAIRPPSEQDPLLVVDLGCGNAYLTFAAHRYLTGVLGLPVRTIGVDVKAQSRTHNDDLAASLEVSEQVSFVQCEIADATLLDAALDTARDDPGGVRGPDVVLALHACDTATDDALAAAVRWESPVVLAAPCCHHDVAAQLRRAGPPSPYSLLTRSGILRERLADTLTDALRAALLRLVGYRVEVVDFIDSRHTPRNTLLRAVRTGAAASSDARREVDDLTGSWGIRPRLAELLGDRLA